MKAVFKIKSIDIKGLLPIGTCKCIKKKQGKVEWLARESVHFVCSCYALFGQNVNISILPKKKKE